MYSVRCIYRRLILEHTIDSPTGEKYTKAKEWGIHCVNAKWLGDIVTSMYMHLCTTITLPAQIQTSVTYTTCTVPLKSKLPPLVSFLSRRESRLERISEAKILE